MKKILTKKGFTLIELIVVIAILAILAAILIPSISNYINEATKSKNVANARSIYSEYMLALAMTPKTDPANGMVAAAAAADKCAIVYNPAGTFAAATDIVSVTCGVGTTAGIYTAP